MRGAGIMENVWMEIGKLGGEQSLREDRPDM